MCGFQLFMHKIPLFPVSLLKYIDNILFFMVTILNSDLILFLNGSHYSGGESRNSSTIFSIFYSASLEHSIDDIKFSASFMIFSSTTCNCFAIYWTAKLSIESISFLFDSITSMCLAALLFSYIFAISTFPSQTSSFFSIPYTFLTWVSPSLSFTFWRKFLIGKTRWVEWSLDLHWEQIGPLALQELVTQIRFNTYLACCFLALHLG